MPTIQVALYGNGFPQVNIDVVSLAMSLLGLILIVAALITITQLLTGARTWQRSVDTAGRLLGLLLFSLVIWPWDSHSPFYDFGYIGRHAAPWVLAAVLTLFVLAVTLSIRNWRHSRQPSPSGTPGWRLLAYFAGLLAAFYVLAWGADNGPNHLGLGRAIVSQMVILGLVMMPVLLLAGVEFARLSEELIIAIAHRFRRPLPSRSTAPDHLPRQSLWPLWIANALIAGISLVLVVHGTGDAARVWIFMSFCWGLCAGLLAFVFRGLRLHKAQGENQTVSSWLTAAGAIALFFGTNLIALMSLPHGTAAPVRSLMDLVPYSHPEYPWFRINYPFSWWGQDYDLKRISLSTVGSVGFLPLTNTSSAEFWVQAGPSSDIKVKSTGQLTPGDILLLSWLGHVKLALPDYGAISTDGPWIVRAFKGRLIATGQITVYGLMWSRRTPDGLNWALIGSTPGPIDASYHDLFRRMARSWQPVVLDVTAPQAQLGGAALASVFMVCLWLIRYRPRAAKGQRAGLFMLLVGMSVTMAYLPPIVAALPPVMNHHIDPNLLFGTAGKQGPYGVMAIFPLTFLGLLGIVNVTTLIIMAMLALGPYLPWQLWRTLRGYSTLAHPLLLIASLNLSLLLLWGAFSGYGQVQQLGEILSPFQGLAVLLVLTWDMALPGSWANNTHGWPVRTVRLLWLLVKVFAAATLVLFFSSLRTPATPQPLHTKYEVDLFPQLGIVYLGVPLVLTGILARLAHWIGHAKVGTEVEGKVYAIENGRVLMRLDDGCGGGQYDGSEARLFVLWRRGRFIGQKVTVGETMLVTVYDINSKGQRLVYRVDGQRTVSEEGQVTVATCGRGCPALTLPPARSNGPLEYGLATCSKYNTNPPRGIPDKGEEVCAQPSSNPGNCWLDFCACQRANIAELAYNRSVLGQHDPAGEPHVAVVMTDAHGRTFYCLKRNAKWIHAGEHYFPVGRHFSQNATSTGATDDGSARVDWHNY